MPLKTDTKLPIFPQEIVELVLNEVAALQSPKTLQACALASRSFCFPCRRLLYSDIFLVVDRCGQARARRIIKTLETLRKGGAFTADVRSLTLVLDVSSKTGARSGNTFGSRGLGSRSKKLKHVGFKAVEMLGRNSETNLEKLLKLVMTPHLTSFALEARGGVIDWRLHLKGEIRTEFFHSLFTHPSLKSLQISHVSLIHKSLVVEALQSESLQELAFINVSLSITETGSPVVQSTNSHLRRLDTRRIAISDFLGAVSTPNPFVTFTQLQNLVISTHWSSFEKRFLRRFILGVAHTLETLEIEHIDLERSHICLDDLLALRNLKIVTTSYGSELRAGTSQAQLCHILSSAKFPTGIQHIQLHFNVQLLGWKLSVERSTWTELDDILSGIGFGNLSRLDIQLDFVYIMMASHRFNGSPFDLGVSDFLPRVAGNMLVECRLETRTICTPLFMREYLQYLV